MSSTTPNSVVGSGGADCDQESASAAAAAAAAAAVASKNAFLELQQAHHLASAAGIGPPPHMSGGPGGPYGMSRNPYQQMQQQHSASAGQLGGYPFSHMTPQNSYAAAAAAAAAGYHHLSPYPSQCPSPPRDGKNFFKKYITTGGGVQISVAGILPSSMDEADEGQREKRGCVYVYMYKANSMAAGPARLFSWASE